jgi:hypothetical protein
VSYNLDAFVAVFADRAPRDCRPASACLYAPGPGYGTYAHS